MKRKCHFFRSALLFFLMLFLIVLPASIIVAQDVAAAPVTSKKNMRVRPLQEKSKFIPLELLMQKLQQNWGMYFSYQADEIKEAKVAYSEGEEKQVKDAEALLKKILYPAGLSYEKINNVFIIKRAVVSNTANSIIDPAVVAFTVSGTVTDGNGPLANVSVAEKGTSNATSTNSAGQFTLNVASPNATLIISHVGYQTSELAVAGQSHVAVTLVSASKEMEAVIVTALGISRSKKSLAYSVAELKTDDLVKAGNPNLMKSIDGKVSGVNLTSLSSDPTSSVLVNIRGTTVLPTKEPGGLNVAVKGQPLYVIDGIPVGNQTFTPKDGVDFGNIISQLNPEDIENITILKGGSAGALYGADGGNGVVMITTKSGRGGKRGIGVSFNSAATWDMPYQFLENQMEYGQGERAFEWQYDNTDSWGPKLDGTYSGDYWDVVEQTWKNKPMLSYHENRLKAYLRTGNTVTNNINIHGNYDKGSFRVSLSNMDNKGVMPNTKTNQKSVSLNTEYRLTNSVKVSVSTSYIHTYSPNKANTAGSNGVINSLLFNFPANLQPISDMRNYWLNGYDGIQQNGAIMNDAGEDVETDNPWWTTYEKIHRFSRDNYFGKIQLDWRLSKTLSLLLRTGMENVKENYELRQSWGQTNLSEKFTNGDGRYVTGNNSSLMVNSDAILSYNNNFGKFSVSVSGGANYAYTNSNSLESEAGKLSKPAFFNLGAAMPGTLTSIYDWGTGRSYSLYGTTTVGYDNKVFLDVTGRNDWRGVLEEEKINYFYPSASLSWMISETFKLPQAFNLVKARLAWADVGNGLTKVRSVDTYSYDPTDWGAVKTVSIKASLVDPNIGAMHSITKEAGIDIGMMQNRIRLDFTWFTKEQKNQIGSIPIVQGTGYSGMLTNIGDVTSKGYEWGLSLTPVKTKNLLWDLSVSFTHYKARITSLSDKFAPNGYVFVNYGRDEAVKIAKGEEIGNIYERNPIIRMKSGKYAGMPLLDNEAGKFQSGSDERDRGKLGNFNPDYIMGFNTTLRYKQFALNLVGSLRKGGHYVSVNQKYFESNGLAKTTLGSGPNNPWWMGGRDAEHGGLPWPAVGGSDYEAINNYNDGNHADWNDAGYAKGVFLNPNYTGDPANASDADYIVNGADPKNTFYDYAYNAYGDVIWSFSATRTYSATNFKMREISLSYTLPGSVLKKYKLDNLTLALITRNVFQWNASGRHEDPETAFNGLGADQGVLRATLPSIRSYGLKLTLDF